MTDAELLVQRFLDQELSAEERIRFVARLGRDETLRLQAIALEQLALDAARLPRPAVPPGFTAGVMNRLETSHAPVPHARTVTSLGSWRWFWRPAAAFAVLLVTAGASAWFVRSRPAPAPATESTTLVRLVVVQPTAASVQVAGDFNGWNPQRTSLTPLAGGAWAVTIPLAPGRYEYMFVIDGRDWIADPYAVEQSDDGFGAKNAVLEVRPDAAPL